MRGQAADASTSPKYLHPLQSLQHTWAMALSAEQVRAIVEASGQGDTLRAKAANVASRIGRKERSVWNYLSKGVRDEVVARALEKLREEG